MTKDQEKRLPAYARAELDRLRSCVSRFEREVFALTSNEPTRVQYGRSLVEGVRYLAETEICFDLGGACFDFGDTGLGHDQDVRCKIEDSHAGRFLRVMGGSAFAVEPRASNVVHIRLAEIDKAKEGVDE